MLCCRFLRENRELRGRSSLPLNTNTFLGDNNSEVIIEEMEGKNSWENLSLVFSTCLSMAVGGQSEVNSSLAQG